MELRDKIADFESQSLQSLVQAAQGGDREAFDSLFARYHRAVYAKIYRRLGNDADTQETCQEVFVQVIRKIHQLENPVCFGGWLMAIAGRMAINRAVRGRTAASLESERAEAACVERETPLGNVLARERRDQVHQGLNRLGPLDRDTLVAFYFRGHSLVQMSDEFDSPVGTIKRRLHVARKRLAEQLETMAPA
jgi:RNA polymerase sigma-70 factor (ECF subfamily)